MSLKKILVAQVFNLCRRRLKPAATSFVRIGLISKNLTGHYCPDPFKKGGKF